MSKDQLVVDHHSHLRIEANSVWDVVIFDHTIICRPVVAVLTLLVLKFLRHAWYFAEVCNSTREDDWPNLFFNIFHNWNFISEKPIVL